MNQVDNSIDQMGEQIGQGIDDAAKDITSGLKKTGEKTGDFWENWRDYLTPNNAEKFVSVALLFPLFMTVVLWLLTRVSGWVYGQYFLPLYDFFFAIFQIAIFLVKAFFLIGSGLGIAAAGYVLYKKMRASGRSGAGLPARPLFYPSWAAWGSTSHIHIMA